MSTTFRPCHPDGRPLLRCACQLQIDGLYVFPLPGCHGGQGAVDQCPACQAQLNTNERNTRDLFAYLGLDHEADKPGEPHGVMASSALAVLIDRRLAMVEAEAAIQPQVQGRLYVGGRVPGYLRERAIELRVLCVLAGDGGCVGWS